MRGSETRIPAKLKTTHSTTPPKANRQDLPGRCWARPTRLQRTGCPARVSGRDSGHPAVAAANWELAQFPRLRREQPPRCELPSPPPPPPVRPTKSVKPFPLPNVLKPGEPQKTSTTSLADPGPLQTFLKRKRSPRVPAEPALSLRWRLRGFPAWEDSKYRKKAKRPRIPIQTPTSNKSPA